MRYAGSTGKRAAENTSVASAPYCAALMSVNRSWPAGMRWPGTMAPTGHALTHAPQSTQVAGSMYSISAMPKSGSSGVGWMQLTGHAYTHDASPQQLVDVMADDVVIDMG